MPQWILNIVTTWMHIIAGLSALCAFAAICYYVVAWFETNQYRERK